MTNIVTYIVTYGVGGFDPKKPNNNIVDEREDPNPVPVDAEDEVPG